MLDSILTKCLRILLNWILLEGKLLSVLLNLGRLLLDHILDLIKGKVGFYGEVENGIVPMLDNNLHWHQVDGISIPNLVICKSGSILQVLAIEFHVLIAHRNSVLVFHLVLDVGNGVGWRDSEFNLVAVGLLDKDLHWVQCQRITMLNAVVGNGCRVVQLFSSGVAKCLAGSGDSSCVLDLVLHLFNRVMWVHLNGDHLSIRCLDIDCHWLKLNSITICNLILPQSLAVLLEWLAFKH
mmetsp:Transcript_30031/g.72107  ORF Transcript_30031/g.72107 Transcript_30031/m.72107 type:complete len:238 (-) Transcript_30031:3335-4048(-)